MPLLCWCMIKFESYWCMIFEKNFYTYHFLALYFDFLFHTRVTNLSDFGQYGKFQCWKMLLVGRESVVEEKCKINPSGWIMWVGIGNLLTWKKQVGQCLEIVWRYINTDWQKRVVKKLSYDNQKGISQILLRHLSSPEQRKV